MVSYVTAKRKTYEEFLSDYRPEDARDAITSSGFNLLFGSLANRSIPDRIAISDLLLDDGADPAKVGGDESIGLLHVLFSQEDHDYYREAGLLRRLIDGGADINHRARKWGVPLKTFMEFCRLADDTVCKPFYDVLFDCPNLDLSVSAGQAGTLQEFIQMGPGFPCLKAKIGEIR